MDLREDEEEAPPVLQEQQKEKKKEKSKKKKKKKQIDIDEKEEEEQREEMKKRVLVIGGTGGVGSWCVRYLVNKYNRQFQPVVLTRSVSKAQERFPKSDEYKELVFSRRERYE